MSDPADVTVVLKAWAGGDQAALDRLTPLVYNELHRLARLRMRHENPAHSMQPTALVNEAWLRLVDGAAVNWQDRAHFYAVSAQIMRRILVDAVRAKGAEKRGAGAAVFQLAESIDAMPDRGRDLVRLDDALDALAAFDARKAKVVELRFFGGLSVDETAAVLAISTQSVHRDWALARAWLLREMST
jgi:RNA polymerase sigma factor (TIGR02999 family)